MKRPVAAPPPPGDNLSVTERRDVPASAPVAIPALRPRPEHVEVLRVEELYSDLATDLIDAWLSEMNRVGDAALSPARRRRHMLDLAHDLGVHKDLARQLMHRFELGWTTSSVRNAPAQVQTARMVEFVLSSK